MKQLLFALGIVLCTACQLTVPDEDQGVLMSGGQMVDFIVRGEVMDSYQNVYEVNAIPGYWGVLKVTGDYLVEAGDELALYAQKEHYTGPLLSSKKFLIEGAWETALKGIVYGTTAQIWQKSFSSVSNSQHTPLAVKLFIWYPAETVKSTVLSAIIIPTGIIMSSIFTVSTVAYPAIYIPTHPILGASFLTLGAAIVFPCGVVWNTLAAPPGVFLATRPEPTRTESNFFTMKPSENFLEAQKALTKKQQDSLNELKKRLQESTHLLDSRLQKAYQNERLLENQLDSARLVIYQLSAQYADSIQNDIKTHKLIQKTSESEYIYTRDDISKMTEDIFKNLRVKDRQAIDDYIFNTYQNACKEPVNRRLPNVKKSECTIELN